MRNLVFVKTVKIALVIVALVLVGEARAVVVVVPPGPGGDYVYNTNVLTDTFNIPPTPWNGNPVEQQDKLWTYVDSTNLDDAPVHFELVVQGGIDYHELKLADNTGSYTLGLGTYELKYSIQTTDPNRVINEASVAVDGHTTDSKGNSLVEIVKTLTDALGNPVATLHSTGGSGDDVLFAGATLLNVDELITVSSGGFVTSTTDTYNQLVVPEPATLVFCSVLGAIGAGLAVWRKRRPA